MFANSFTIKLWLFVFSTTTSYFTFAQHHDRRFADTAFVYKGFGQGGTTANLWYYSKAVDTIENIRKILIDAVSLDTLNFLIGHSKSKRHFQQKIGPSFYASIIRNGQERRIAVVPAWAILDLTNKRQYVFRDTPFAEIYSRFVDGNYR